MLKKITKPLRFMTTVGLIILGLACQSHKVNAEVRTVPFGEYQNSCKGCKTMHGQSASGAVLLHCDACQDNNYVENSSNKLELHADWQESSENICNVNGELQYLSTCPARTPPKDTGEFMAVPNGQYKNSCTGCKTMHGQSASGAVLLHCDACKDNGGANVDSGKLELHSDWKENPKNICNANGKLEYCN